MLRYTLSTPPPAQMPTLVTLDQPAEEGHVNLLIEGVRVAFLTPDGRLGLARLSSTQRFVRSHERAALAAKGVAFTDSGYYDVVPE
jgi:hypothetical protein